MGKGLFIPIIPLDLVDEISKTLKINNFKVNSQTICLVILIFMECKMRKTDSIKITHSQLKRFGINYQTSIKKLRELKQCNIISMENKKGRTSTITILPPYYNIKE